MANSGKSTRADCPVPGSSNDQWEQVVVRYNLEDAGGEPFAQPTVLTRIMEARADAGDPGIACVTLTSIARIRDLAQAAVATPQDGFSTPDLVPPIAHPSTALPPLVDTFQRGGLPQWLVTFQNGSPQGAKVYCDSNSRLALPTRFVSIALVTPLLLLANRVVGGSDEIGPGLIVEAEAAAHVSFSTKPGLVNSGPLTWSQSAHSVVDNVLIFERPPFAKRVVVIPPPTIGAVVQHLCSPTLVVATPPPVSNQAQVSQDLAAVVTHVQVALAGLPGSQLVHCIWELSL